MKIKKLALVIFGALSGSTALAVVNGTSIDWSQANSKVEMNCTGELIAGKWVLTAAHCTWPSAGGLRDVNFSPAHSEENAGISTVRQVVHPDYDSNGPDLSLWEQSGFAAYDKITPLSTRIPTAGERVKLHGFGGTWNLATAELEVFDPTFTPLPSRMYMKAVGSGYGEPGDSGGAVTDTNDLIVALHSSDSGGGEFVTSHINGAKDFILATIDNWHYPTRANTVNGSGEVTVQSLHVNDVADSAYAEGDLTITGGTCVGQTTLAPFGTCTYEIESAGGEGTLVLSENAQIKVNHVYEDNSGGDGNSGESGGSGSSGDSSGGSVGAIGLALLGLSALARRRKAYV